MPAEGEDVGDPALVRPTGDRACADEEEARHLRRGEVLRVSRRGTLRFSRDVSILTQLSGRRYPSRVRTSCCTTCGFAVPFDALMTWPTKNPKSAVLPAR